MSLFENIQNSKNYLQQVLENFKPSIAIQTGTGMTTSFEGLEIIREVPFQNIPHFVTSTAPSHMGRLLFCTWKKINLLVLDGRFHYYEGYTMREVTYPIYLLKALNIEHLILTNASGSVNPDIIAGSIVNILDHINLHPDNPLRGKNDERVGPRFPGMSSAYDIEGSDIIEASAEAMKLDLKKGIYLGLPGPNFETPAEYRMARLLGADVIGMSTVPEVIAANHCGLKVNVLSIVSNQFDPLNSSRGPDLDEVLTMVHQTSNTLMTLLLSAIEVFHQRWESQYSRQ